MTIDRSKNITIPAYVFNIVLSIISAAIIAWGIMSANTIRISRNERDIQLKADKQEIQRIYETLAEIKAEIREMRNEKN